MENPKTILKASIHEIDIHIVQIGLKFNAVWCKKDSDLVEIQDSIGKTRQMKVHPHLNPFWNPVGLSTAMRRFKKLVRAAQDPRITFES